MIVDFEKVFEKNFLNFYGDFVNIFIKFLKTWKKILEETSSLNFR